jgi:hypothetical protein
MKIVRFRFDPEWVDYYNHLWIATYSHGWYTPTHQDDTVVGFINDLGGQDAAKFLNKTVIFETEEDIMDQILAKYNE